jgi:hypothetical protein
LNISQFSTVEFRIAEPSRERVKPLMIMNRAFRFVIVALLASFISGCASYWERQEKVTDEEHWQVIGDTLHDYFPTTPPR